MEGPRNHLGQFAGTARAEPVHRVKRVSHDAQHTYGRREREGSAAPQSLCHRLTRHVLHREEELAVGQAVEIVDLSDRGRLRTARAAAVRARDEATTDIDVAPGPSSP